MCVCVFERKRDKERERDEERERNREKHTENKRERKRGRDMGSESGSNSCGSGKLVDGVHKLNDGGRELAEGMKKFNDEGIKKISDFTEGDIEKVLERMKSLKDLSEDYTNYSGISKDMEGEVKFIIETAPIEEDK